MSTEPDMKALSALTAGSYSRIRINEEEVLVENGMVDCDALKATIMKHVAKGRDVDVTFEAATYSFNGPLVLSGIDVPLRFDGGCGAVVDSCRPLSPFIHEGVEVSSNLFPMLSTSGGTALQLSKLEGTLAPLGDKEKQILNSSDAVNLPLTHIRFTDREGLPVSFSTDSKFQDVYIYVFARWMAYRLKADKVENIDGVDCLQCSGACHKDYLSSSVPIALWMVNYKENSALPPHSYTFAKSIEAGKAKYTFDITDANGAHVTSYENYRVGMHRCLLKIINCRHVSFSGLCFRNNGMEQFRNEAGLFQAEEAIGAAVQIVDSHDVLFKNCRFKQLTGYCVAVDESGDEAPAATRRNMYKHLSACRNSYVRFVGNEFSDTYGGGISINRSSNCMVHNNLIRDFGQLQCGAVGILLRTALRTMSRTTRYSMAITAEYRADGSGGMAMLRRMTTISLTTISTIA